MIVRLLRRLTTAETMGITLVLLALASFTHGISASLRNTDTSSFFWFCLAAAVIGFGLGRIRLSGILAQAGMAALGVLLVWILGAHLTRPLLDLIEAVPSGIPRVIPAVRYGEPIDVPDILEAWTIIVQASSALWARLQTWVLGLNQGVTINDALIRSMVWMLILWLCSAWMGWFAAKRNAAVSFLPSMTLLAAVTSYSEHRYDSLWVMAVLLILLMGVWNYRNHTLQWLKQRIDCSDSIRFDNSQAVMILALAIGTCTFITPSISWRDVADRLRERQSDDRTAETLGIQEPRGAGGTLGLQEPSLPRDHLLGGGPANSEQVVMTIRTGELPPSTAPAMEVPAPRHYWRSTVYDRYVGTGWVTGAVFPQTVPANTPLIPGLLNGYRLLHLEVRLVRPESRLFWSGTLFSADIPLTAEWRIPPPSGLFADRSALLQADLFAAVTNAQTYSAETYVLVPALDDLRSAGADYPEEIRERYLNLPASVPNRVHDLARQITDGLINPYDRAKAIETHLRTNYLYDLEVPAPPEGRDVADYFLFELKKGYCDYYATAMVVLARASGLPARFVSGYAPGSYDAPSAQYVVRELNAHSWAEVYFPGMGWVEFEPTASLPEIERAQAAALVPSDQAGNELATELLVRFRMQRILLWATPLLVVLAFAVAYFTFMERWLILRLSPEAAIEAVYQRFYRAGRGLAGAWTRAETSSEFLHKLTSRLAAVQNRTRFKRLTQDIRANALSLTEIYHASLFIERRVRKHDAVAAWRIWKRLRGQLFIAKFL